MNTPQDTKPIPKRRTIAVAIAIVVVVASSIALVILTTMHQEQGTHDGPRVTYSKAPIAGGQQVNIVSFMIMDVTWDQIKVQVSDGTYFWEWNVNTADLDGGSAVTFNYGSKTLGGLTVWLNVTDASGNGFPSSGDYFTVTANPVFPIV